MAIQIGVDAGGVADDVHIGPGFALGFAAGVSHGDHVLSALFDGGVHGGLHSVVHAFAGLILKEAVDELTLIIHEVSGGGRGQGLGGGDAHEGNLHAVELLDHIGLENQFAFLVEGGADVGEVGLFGQLQEALHAVVELVVAGGSNVVAHSVHQVDQRFALGHGANRFALDGVAVVHQHNVVVLSQRIAQGSQTGIAPATFDAAMHVAGVQDHQVLRQRRSSSFFCNSGAAQQHGQRKDQTKNLLHGCFLPFILECMEPTEIIP